MSKKTKSLKEVLFTLLGLFLVSFSLTSCGDSGPNEAIVAFAEENTSIPFIFESIGSVSAARLEAGSGNELLVTLNLVSEGNSIVARYDALDATGETANEWLLGMLESAEGLLIIAANATRDGTSLSSVDVVGRFEINGEIRAYTRVTSE